MSEKLTSVAEEGGIIEGDYLGVLMQSVENVSTMKLEAVCVTLGFLVLMTGGVMVFAEGKRKKKIARFFFGSCLFCMIPISKEIITRKDSIIDMQKNMLVIYRENPNIKPTSFNEAEKGCMKKCLGDLSRALSCIGVEERNRILEEVQRQVDKFLQAREQVPVGVQKKRGNKKTR